MNLSTKPTAADLRQSSTTLRRKRSSPFASYDFTDVDAFARHLPDGNFYDARSLAHALTAPYAGSQLRQVRSVFSWIATHVEYDTYSFFNNAVRYMPPEEVLQKRLAVCAGYAGMFADLCKHAGIECIEVGGYGKGYGYTPDKGAPTGYKAESNHAWNAVRLHTLEDAGGGRQPGEWYMVDACWGAGPLVNDKFVYSFNPFYFLTDPAEFIYDHMPSTAREQFLPAGKPPVTWREFYELPKLEPKFWESDVEVCSQMGPCGVIAGRLGQETELRLTIPRDIIFYTRVHEPTGQEARPFETRHYTADVERLLVTAAIRPSMAGVHKIQVIGHHRSEPEDAWHQLVAVSFDIAPDGGFVPDGRSFVQRSWGSDAICLMQPRLVPLRAGERQVFEVVQLIDADRPQDSALTGALTMRSPTNKMHALHRASGDPQKTGEVTWRADVGLNERGDWELVDLRQLGRGAMSWTPIATFPVA